MYLFINTLSAPNIIILFDNNRIIIDSFTWSEKQREFDVLIEQIDRLMSRNNLPYSELSGIVVVNGPGGFTGTRITTLVANTLAMSYGIPLYPLSVGQVFELIGAPLPWMMPLTKREVLVWIDSDTTQHTCVMKNELPTGTYSSLENIDFETAGYTIDHISDTEKLVNHVCLNNPQTIIHPLYAK